MTIKSSGSSLAFSEIENEFGQNGSRSLGSYRLSQSVGELSNLPLDSGVPTSGQIKFSDFYSKSLNVIVDMHSGSTEFRKSARSDKWNNNQVTVIGGFRSKKESGSKIIIHINKKFGSDKSNVNNCAVKTGSWSAASVQVDVGGEGQVLGAGGNGGQGGSCLSGGQAGFTGTSGLGVEHNGLTVNVLSGGIIRAGFGGGGGGGGGRQSDKGSDRRASGGGGGGGAGFPAGEGAADVGGCGGANGSGGTDGNETTAGDGGNGHTNAGEAGGGGGGEGGQFGENANNGGSSQAGGGSGGGNGAAIRRNSGFSVTINNSGTIQGSTNATGVG
jgi:hypothetical protein